ncbi:hypothetical protein ACQKND_04295 [Viridibacillus arvi]|uniref:hypothetical protein n=1 Tax=Viridibacillus arvi TaxID=263475 RepID=UPI003D07C7E6
MKKILLTSMLLGLCLVSYSTVSFAASENSSVTRDEAVQSTKEYILKSREDKINLLKELPENSSKDVVNDVLDQYVLENPAPEYNLDSEISIEELFPEVDLVKASKNVTINITDIIEQEKALNPGNVFEFNDGSNVTDVLIDETGQITTTSRTFHLEDNILSSRAAWKYKSDTNEMVISNAVGVKMIRFMASGSFKYNGSDVGIELGDGSVDRYTAGSTITVLSKTVGKSRKYTLEGYKYAEVYTRASIESTVAFKYLNLLISSGTFEVYTGSTVNGNIYGSAKKI